MEAAYFRIGRKPCCKSGKLRCQQCAVDCPSFLLGNGWYDNFNVFGYASMKNSHGRPTKTKIPVATLLRVIMTKETVYNDHRLTSLNNREVKGGEGIC